MRPRTELNPVKATTLPEAPCPNPRHDGFKTRRKDAQVTVEFALICIPFFAILFATIDYAQIYFYENSLQNAMREAARFATAGRIIQAYNSDGSLAYDTNAGVVVPRAILDSHGNEASRNECIRWWFLSNCIFAIPLSNIMISNAAVLPGDPPVTTTNSYGDVILLSGYTVSTNGTTVSTNSSPAVKGPGAANNYIQVTAIMTVPTITPLMTYLSGYNHGNYNSYPVHVSAIVKNEPALLNFLHTNIYSYEP